MSLRSRRIVLAVLGSWGDLHPLLALGLALRDRGHVVRLAAEESYRTKIEGEGLEFAPLRPSFGLEDEATAARLMDGVDGARQVVQQLVMPAVRETHEDLLAACSDADLLIHHIMVVAAPLAATALRIPWASAPLNPLAFFSAYDPPVLPNSPQMERLRFLGPWVFPPLMRLAKRHVASWCRPYFALRDELGMTHLGHPLFEGQFSPYLNLALFSPLFGRPQVDWPPHSHATGFLFHDREHAEDDAIPRDVARFLDAGDAPILFTLGSAAVHAPGPFYEIASAASGKLGERALLLVGTGWRGKTGIAEGGRLCVARYARHSAVMAAAKAIVHQGGIGTTAQALRAGRPMLVVPFAHDQPDNCARVVRMGVGRRMQLRDLSVKSLLDELRSLLNRESYRERALAVREHLTREDGAAAACDLVETMFA